MQKKQKVIIEFVSIISNKIESIRFQNFLLITDCVLGQLKTLKDIKTGNDFAFEMFGKKKF